MNGLAAPDRKLSDADSDAKLRAISLTNACAEGRVVTLDFSAIERRFGARWHGRREDVWQKLEAIIEHHAGRSGLWLRMLDSEYLVCVVGQHGADTQSLGIRVMEEALSHFMGRFMPEDVLVNRVTSIAGRTVSRVPAKPGSAPPVPQRANESKSFAPEWEALTSPHLVADSIDPLILSCSLQDIVNLKTEAKVGLRIDARYKSQQNGRELTIAERAALSGQALMTMDRRIAEALPVLFETHAPKALVAPCSLHTFGASRGRWAVLEQLNRLDRDQRNRLIIELGGFDVGTPSSRLIEAASLLKPFCRFVSAQPVPTRLGVATVVNARFPAVSVTARELGGDGARLASGLLAFGEAAKGLAPRRIATDLPSETFISVCSVAGYTAAAVSCNPGPGMEKVSSDEIRRPASQDDHCARC